MPARSQIRRLCARIATVAMLAALAGIAPAVRAGDQVVDFDRQVDFSSLRTFTMRLDSVLLNRPEVDSPLVHQQVTASVRAALLAKGLREVAEGGDLLVDWTLLGQRMAINEWGRAVPLDVMRGGRPVPANHPWRDLPESFVEGTLVLDLVQAGSGLLVWRGVLRNNERTSARLAHNVAGYAKKLLAEYPPRRK